MPSFFQTYPLSVKKIYFDGIYELAIQGLAYAGTIATSCLSALSYLETSLPTLGQNTTVIYSNSSIIINTTVIQTPNMEPVTASTTTLVNNSLYPAIVDTSTKMDLDELITPVVIGAIPIVCIAGTVHLAIDLWTDRQKETNRLEPAIFSLTHRRKFEPNSDGSQEEPRSEFRSALKRSWTWLTPVVSGLIGAWWLGYSAEQMQHVLAYSGLDSFALTVLVVGGIGARGFYKARQRNDRPPVPFTVITIPENAGTIAPQLATDVNTNPYTHVVDSHAMQASTPLYLCPMYNTAGAVNTGHPAHLGHSSNFYPPRH